MVRTAVWIVTMCWMAGMLYTSSLGQAVTPVTGLLQTLVSKLGHVVEYAILGGLLAMAFRLESSEWLWRRVVVAAVLIGVTFAAFDELRQSFVPGREPRVTDVFLDLASIIGGAVVMSRILGQETKEPPTGVGGSVSVRPNQSEPISD